MHTSRLPSHVVSGSPGWDAIVLIGSRCWMVCVLDRWILMDPGVPTHGQQFAIGPVCWTSLLGRTIFALLTLPSPTSECCSLWLPLPLSSRACWCGHTQQQRFRQARCAVVAKDSSGRREAGARVSTNLFVRDSDLPVARHDGRRVGLWASSVQWCSARHSHTGLSSSCRRFPLASVCSRDSALAQARRVKRTYPELSGNHGRSRLVFSQLRSEAIGQRRLALS